MCPGGFFILFWCMIPGCLVRATAVGLSFLKYMFLLGLLLEAWRLQKAHVTKTGVRLATWYRDQFLLLIRYLTLHDMSAYL